MPIHYELGDDHVVQVTIDRPEKRNALDLHHFRDLAAAWRRFAADEQAWVAVVTGSGRNFMAGADLESYIPQITRLQKEIASGAVTQIDGCRLSDGPEAVLRNAKLWKPVIAAVGGPCVAGGMEMLGGCDIRIATRHARFGVMEPKRGLFAGGGTTVRLPRQIAFPAAMEFLLTAEAFPAERALQLGLINEIVEEEELAERARLWARRITANAPLAVQATKESVLRGLGLPLQEAYGLEVEISRRVFQSEDAKEGPLAFVEKRAPALDGPLTLLDEPASPKLVVRSAGDKGRGVYAREALARGEYLAAFTGWVLPTAELSDDLFALQIGIDLWLCSRGERLDDCINHGCEPNAGFLTGEPVLFALRDVEAGEEIVFDYATSISELGWSLECGCGAAGCRRRILPWPEMARGWRDAMRPLALRYLR